MVSMWDVPQAAVQIAQRLLAPGGPALPPPLLLRLAELLPEAAPGNLALGAKRSALADAAGGARQATQLPGAGTGGLLAGLPSRDASPPAPATGMTSSGPIGGAAASGTQRQHADAERACLQAGRHGAGAGAAAADVMDLTLSDDEDAGDAVKPARQAGPTGAAFRGEVQELQERRASHAFAGSSGSGAGGVAQAAASGAGHARGAGAWAPPGVGAAGKAARGSVPNNPFARGPSAAGADTGPQRVAGGVAGHAGGGPADHGLDDVPLAQRMGALRCAPLHACGGGMCACVRWKHVWGGALPPLRVAS